MCGVVLILVSAIAAWRVKPEFALPVEGIAKVS